MGKKFKKENNKFDEENSNFINLHKNQLFILYQINFRFYIFVHYILKL